VDRAGPGFFCVWVAGLVRARSRFNGVSESGAGSSSEKAAYARANFTVN